MPRPAGLRHSDTVLRWGPFRLYHVLLIMIYRRPGPTGRSIVKQPQCRRITQAGGREREREKTLTSVPGRGYLLAPFTRQFCLGFGLLRGGVADRINHHRAEVLSRSLEDVHLCIPSSRPLPYRPLGLGLRSVASHEYVSIRQGLRAVSRIHTSHFGASQSGFGLVTGWSSPSDNSPWSTRYSYICAA